MKRTASMNLDWERDEYGSYIAQLPPVPGYPGTWYATVDHFMGISTAGDWHLTISNRPNPTVFLYKDIPGIVFHAKTPEELMNIVEERLTPEMIADALQAEGYMPNVDVAASRKADKRTASMDLNWHEGMNGLPSADLPDIPGYPCKGGRHWQVNFDNISTIGTDEFLGYGFYISLRGAHHGTTLEEYDFGFEPADTTEEVMREVESLSPEEIADAAAAKGLEPVEED